VAGEDEMAVRAADAERADARDAGAVRLPRLDRGGYPQAKLTQGDAGVGRTEIGHAHQLAGADAERRLDEAGDAGGPLQVPDAGLQRAHRQRGIRRPDRAEHRAQRRRLDRVARGGAGAVQLDVADGGRVHGRVRVRPAQQPLLRPRVGDAVGRSPAVVVDRAAGQYTVDRVAVGQRVLQEAQQHHAAAFPTDVPVGARVEGVAAGVRREGARAVDGQGAVRGEDQVDAAGQRRAALTAAHGPGRQVYGDQRRGLPGVHDDAGTAQAERVRHPVGDPGPQQAGEAVRGDRPGTEVVGQQRVVVVDGTEVDAGVPVAEPLRGPAGVLERLPGQLQREPLARVHGGRLAGRDPEEPGVEAGYVVQEAAHPAGRRERLRVVVGHRRQPLRRDRTQRVPARAQQRRQLGRCARTGQPARDPDNGDRPARRGSRAPAR
jgi:hypothetical protein